MDIGFTYKEGTEFSDIEKAFLMQKSKAFGKVTIKTYSTRFGTTDLVSLLEVSLIFAVVTNLQAFAKGFIGEDWFKALGQKTRLELENELKATKNFIKAYYDCFIRNKPNEQKAYVINEQIGDINLYVAINLYQMTDALLDKLPEALVDTYGKISLGYLDIESKICQLFPDFELNEWRYLFSPTYKGFGNYIDKYYDFKSNKLIRLNSKQDFIDRFDMIDEDKYKLIINALIVR